MIPYNSSLFDPPAPFANVQLRNPATNQTWADAPMLLDSGADATLVPRAVIERIGVALIQDTQFEVMGYDGQVKALDIVVLELTSCRRRFTGQYLLTDESWGIIGRNILNRLSLLFDGPNLQWDEWRR